MGITLAADLASFVNDLAEWFPLRWLLRYYSPELLWSAEARADFVPPDLQRLDF